jgi:Tetratricopeptide repeat
VADNPRIEELRRRVQKDPASIAFAQLAEEYRRAGEHDEAVRVCRTGLAKHPSYLSARVTLGRALIELAQYDEARTELDYVLRSAPENLAAIRGLAEIYQRRGQLEEALKQYQAALGIAKHDPELEEAVDELTRQLGGSVEPRAEVRTPGNRVPQPRTETSTRATAASIAPPVPVQDADAATSALPAPAGVPPLTLETFEPVADAEAIPFSPELEAAADEFTRALEALDAITIDVATPPLATQSFELPPIPLPEDDQLVPEQEWERAFGASPGVQLPAPAGDAPPVEPTISDRVSPTSDSTGANDSNAAAIADLENWLDNIVLDRGVKHESI